MSKADRNYDRDHGAARRPVNLDLERFAGTVPAGARVIEVGAGIYDHTSFFTGPVESFNADPATEPDVLGDAHHMPIEDETYDVVVCISTLEHVRNPYQVASEIHRILKPGGTCYAWVPFYFHVHDFPIDVSRFTREGAQVLFEEAGFSNITTETAPWAGVFHNLHNTVHFVISRQSPRPWVRKLNRGLLTIVRAGFPLDRWLKLRTLYSGVSIVARRD